MALTKGAKDCSPQRRSDVFKEDHAEDDMLALGGVRTAHSLCSKPSVAPLALPELSFCCFILRIFSL
jgi:hypothetical protein